MKSGKIKVIRNLSDWNMIRKNVSTRSIGFVPTMGALHAGHEALLQKSIGENEVTVLSIYINPTQFEQKSDLETYPETWTEDIELAEKLGVDFVLAPKFSDIYPHNYRFRVSEDAFSKRLCGATRKGHFEGVLTIVLKLLNLVRADRAYFGEKDYQQFSLIRDMCESFFIDTKIVSCPIVREASGLAMSSRNRRLSKADLLKAPNFQKILKQSVADTLVSAKLVESGFEVDYIETHQGRRYGAVFLGEKNNSVRLIDNVRI